MKGLRDKYEAHHRIKIPDEAIEAAVKLSVRYVTGRYLPDKAIDVIDEACSRVRLSSLTTPPDLKQLEDEIAAVAAKKEEAVKGQDYENAAKLRDEEKSSAKLWRLARRSGLTSRPSPTVLSPRTTLQPLSPAGPAFRSLS